MRLLTILLIVLFGVIVRGQDTTTVTTATTGDFAAAITTSVAATTTGAPAPPPPSNPDNRTWYEKLRDLGVVNLVFIGIGAGLLLLCLYACTCFDRRKPPLKYNDIEMQKFK